MTQAVHEYEDLLTSRMIRRRAGRIRFCSCGRSGKKEMADLYREGRIGHIGVSNFTLKEASIRRNFWNLVGFTA